MDIQVVYSTVDQMRCSKSSAVLHLVVAPFLSTVVLNNVDTDVGRRNATALRRPNVLPTQSRRGGVVRELRASMVGSFAKSIRHGKVLASFIKGARAIHTQVCEESM